MVSHHLDGCGRLLLLLTTVVLTQAEAVAARGEEMTRPIAATVEFPDALMAQIDTWAQEHRVTRTEAIRQLVVLGLGANPPAHPGKMPLPKPQVRPTDK
jgi:hypothetical protein